MSESWRMSRRCGRIGRALALVGVFLSARAATWSQQVQVQTPLQGTTQGFYEQTQVSWSFRRGNFFAEWPGGNAVPPFGGPDPNALAQLGGQFRGPNGGQGSFRISMGQGSSTTNSLAGSTLTLPDGGFGFVNSVQISPFVTGVVPVVNEGFMIPTVSPLQERIARLATEGAPPPPPPMAPRDDVPLAPPSESSAATADVSLSEIRQSLAREDRERLREIRRSLEKARELEEAKPNVARYYYKAARRHAPPAWIDDIDQSLRRVERRLQSQRSTSPPRTSSALPEKP